MLFSVMKWIFYSLLVFQSLSAELHYLGRGSEDMQDLMEKAMEEICDSHVPDRHERVLFHGSPCSREKIRPIYLEKRDESDALIWRGQAVFASYDFRISLFYTHDKVDAFYADIDLSEFKSSKDPIVYDIIGGNSLDEVLDLLFGKKGSKGSIYFLDPKKFAGERGLGAMEVVSRDMSTGLARFELDRRSAVDMLVEDGQAGFKFLAHQSVF